MATISVAPGNIGTKTDRTNLLTYALTGAMSQVTEKINGVTVDTKTLTSGQSTVVALDQAEWDSVRYGKYATSSAGLNTLEISMGTEKWTYTFDKRNGANDDLLSVVKSVQDAQSVYLPAVKSKLASAITSKGGTATGADSWDTLVSAVGGITLGRKWASGTLTSGDTTMGLSLNASGGVSNRYPLNISGLSFSPSVVVAYSGNSNGGYSLFIKNADLVTSTGNQDFLLGNTGTIMYAITGSNFKTTSDGIILPIFDSGVAYNWFAFE